MNHPWRKPLVAFLVALSAAGVQAVTAVNPFGVNVRASGASTVFLTFQNLDPGERTVEAYWCGELRPELMAVNPQLQLPVAVQSADPCLPGTVYGRLPASLDRARASRSGSFANLSDIMTIPPSVARRAYQDAQAGRHSAFFYVRRFVGPAGERFVVVTCRMGGGGARTPLALLEVRLAFDGEPVATVFALARGERPPRSSVRLHYNGSGTLRARWEVVQPGDPEPVEQDLLTEATLTAEQRPLQRRWRVVQRFEQFLPPTGDATLPGPDPALLPTDAEGPYKLLLRVEASDDKEARSDTGDGRLLAAGGVAGFPMPVLRYHVGSGTAAPAAPAAGDLTLLGPMPGRWSGEALHFAWLDGDRGRWHRLEVEVDAQPALAAIVAPGTLSYTAPPWWLAAHRGRALRWRVVALDAAGEETARSAWRALEVP